MRVRGQTAGWRRAHEDRGYTLVELLVSSALVMTVLAAILAVVVPSAGHALIEPDSADMQQRLRIGAAALTADLRMAGAGPYVDAPLTLGHLAAAILPRRVGGLRPDTEDTVVDDRISLIYVPPTAAQATLRDSLISASGPIAIATTPGCPAGSTSCGFAVGMTMAVFDITGALDAFTITGVQDVILDVRHQGAALTKTYAAGSRVAEVKTITYWWDRANARLMRYDGDRSDMPILDHVVLLRFEYFGDPRPPALTISAIDPARRLTTYGPTPPAAGVDDPADAWSAGENCVFQFDAATSAHVSRLPDLGSAGGTLVPLAASSMQNGPWCVDGAAPNRYDADLLRIRTIRVTLRVEAARASLRGPAGQLFARGGTARGASRVLPDREIRFDVAPRNLVLGG